MLIKSQDKEALHMIGLSNTSIWCEEYRDGLGIYVNGMLAGEYSTTEKAHEILNEIQLELLAESKIYLMPQDDEVEV